jgi:hypothetical protein
MRATRLEHEVLLAVFETILPSGASAGGPLGASDAPMACYVDDLLRHAPAHFGWGLRACTWLVWLCPLLVLGRARTFLGLSRTDRARLLDRLAESPVYLIRELPLLFKTVACLGFCGLPAVQRGLGIPLVHDVTPDWACKGSDAP